MILFKASQPVSRIVASVASTCLAAMGEGQADEIVREEAFEAVRAVLHAFAVPADALLWIEDESHDQDGTLLVKWQDASGVTQDLFIDEAGVIRVGTEEC